MSQKSSKKILRRTFYFDFPEKTENCESFAMDIY